MKILIYLFNIHIVAYFIVFCTNLTTYHTVIIARMQKTLGLGGWGGGGVGVKCYIYYVLHRVAVYTITTKHTYIHQVAPAASTCSTVIQICHTQGRNSHDKVITYPDGQIILFHHVIGSTNTISS